MKQEIRKVGSVVAVQVLMTLAGTVALQQTGYALCIGDSYNRRVSVGTLPDLVFTAGIPSTKYIKPVKLNFSSRWAEGVVTYSDCQAYARSNVAGVSVTDTYVSPGTIRPAGVWAGIDQSSGPVTPYPYFRYWGYPDPASGQIPIVYDGSGAPRVGSIDIAVNERDLDSGFSPSIMARVNVYIVARGTVETAFTVTSKANTATGPNLVLDHALLNNNAAAKVFAQHYGTGMAWNHPIAVWYDTSRGRWNIRNEDGTKMPVGLTFSVRIDPEGMFVQTLPANQSHYLLISHPITNGNPYANIVVTAVSGGDRRMTQPFAVAYSHPYWLVMFTSAVPMPTSSGANIAGFNVKIVPASHYVDDTRVGDPSGLLNTQLSNGSGTDIVASAGRMSGNTKFLSHWCWTVNRSIQPIIATLNLTPLPPPAPVNYSWTDWKIYGVGTIGNIAVVFKEDGSFMDGRTPFNVWGPYRADCP